MSRASTREPSDECPARDRRPQPNRIDHLRREARDDGDNGLFWCKRAKAQIFAPRTPSHSAAHSRPSIECRMFTPMTKACLQQIELDTTIFPGLQEAADQCQPVDVILAGTFLTVLQDRGTMIEVDRPLRLWDPRD